MEDIEILENMECGDDGELKQALTNAIQALKERQADKEKIKELENDYNKIRDKAMLKHIELKDYIENQIQYSLDLGFECCVEELEKVRKLI